MKLITRGKQLPLTDAIVRYVNTKVGRLTRYWPSLSRAEVTCTVEPVRVPLRRHRVEAHVTVGGVRFHAEDASFSLYHAIDGTVRKLERQLNRKKGLLNRRLRARLRRQHRIRRATLADVETREEATAEDTSTVSAERSVA